MNHPGRRRCVCGLEGAAGRARDAVRRFVKDTACGQVVPRAAREAALLVATELVTNAVRHTGGPCVLEVAWAAGGIDIDVTDPDPTPPRPRPPDMRGDGGFGWPLVTRLASHVEVRPSNTGGKTIHTHITAA